MKNKYINFSGLFLDYKRFSKINDYLGFSYSYNKYIRVLENYYNNYSSPYFKKNSFIDYLIYTSNSKTSLILLDSFSKYLNKNKFNFIMHSIISLSEIDNHNIFQKYKSTKINYFIFLFFLEIIKLPIAIIFIFYKYFIFTVFIKKKYKITNNNQSKVIIIGGTSGLGYCLSNVIADHSFSVSVFSKNQNNILKINQLLKKHNILNNLKYLKLDILKDTNSHLEIFNECKNFKNIFIIYNSAIKSKSIEISNKINFEYNINLSNFLNKKLRNKNCKIKHVFISSNGKNLESINFPFYNASKSYLSNIIKSYKLINYKNKKIEYCLIEPGLVNTKMIKNSPLIKLFSLNPDKAAKNIFNLIFYSKKSFYLVGKKYVLINLIFKFLPISFKFYILEKFSSSEVTK